VYFDFLYKSDVFLIVGRTKKDMIKNVYWSSCKVPVILIRFSKNTQITNFIKICIVKAELFHADGQT